jgi:hypothetical protein
MTRQEIEILLSQHSPDESMREAQLADVVRDLLKDNARLKSYVLKAQSSFDEIEQITSLTRFHSILWVDDKITIPKQGEGL